ncbi:MAG: hypothetical protein WBD55_01115 [Dehalococcoidia bacterium]
MDAKTLARQAFLRRVFNGEAGADEEEGEAMLNAFRAIAGSKGAGVGYKEGPTSFGDVDAWEALYAFSAIVSNIVSATDIDTGQKLTLLEDAAAELRVRLGAGATSDKELQRFVAQSVDDLIDKLTPIIAGDRNAKAKTKATADLVGVLRTRIRGVLDPRGRRKAEANAALTVFAPPPSRYPLGRLWQSFGLDGAAVAKELRRVDGRNGGAKGATRQRMYQLLQTDDEAGQRRVVRAVRDVALRRGASLKEFEAAARALVPRLVAERKSRETKAGEHPAAAYVTDLFR